ncbi:MAG: MCE family protein [Ignavibacteria bacterium]|jgi:phospholipid/cholesterol/gamma-HCH transport system substrate-binding protein|nr:MCE family protein [Ignavibacteria bacterium]MCU7502916.1 MCE family protein [Ignavibacteria bacterium]MCU7515590.1 MCE family protein [Ignavibacteria bacterium]
MPEQNEKKVNLKVGLTVFSGIAVLMIFIILIGTDDYFFSKTYSLFIYTDNTIGLVKGAPVTLGGFKIGDVESMDFVPSNSRDAIKIRLRILKEYQGRITVNSVASISSIGILGDKFINITLGNPGEQALADNATIPLSEGLNLENVAGKIVPGIDKLNNILNNVSDMTDSINAGKGTIGELIKTKRTANEVSGALNNINMLISDIKSTKGSLGSLLYDKQLYTNLTSASENISRLAAGINNGKGTLGQLAASDSLYRRINTAAAKFNSIIAKADQDSSVINGLMSDKNLYKKLNNAIENLNSLTNDIRENPSRYLKVSVF